MNHTRPPAFSALLICAATLLALPACTSQPEPDPAVKHLEFTGGRLYYSDAAGVTNATRLGDWLLANGYFKGKTDHEFYLYHDGNRFMFGPVGAEPLVDDHEFLKMLGIAAVHISTEVFDGRPVAACLFSESFGVLAKASVEVKE